MTMLLSLLSWFSGSTIGRYVGIGLISLVIIWVILNRAKASGSKDLQLSQTEKALDILRERLQHENDLSNLTRAQRIERMQQWTTD